MNIRKSEASFSASIPPTPARRPPRPVSKPKPPPASVPSLRYSKPIGPQPKPASKPVAPKPLVIVQSPRKPPKPVKKEEKGGSTILQLFLALIALALFAFYMWMPSPVAVITPPPESTPSSSSGSKTDQTNPDIPEGLTPQEWNALSEEEKQEFMSYNTMGRRVWIKAKRRLWKLAQSEGEGFDMFQTFTDKLFAEKEPPIDRSLNLNKKLAIGMTYEVDVTPGYMSLFGFSKIKQYKRLELGSGTPETPSGPAPSGPAPEGTAPESPAPEDAERPPLKYKTEYKTEMSDPERFAGTTSTLVGGLLALGGKVIATTAAVTGTTGGVAAGAAAATAAAPAFILVGMALLIYNVSKDKIPDVTPADETGKK